jgi:hypothetical protein
LKCETRNVHPLEIPNEIGITRFRLEFLERKEETMQSGKIRMKTGDTAIIAGIRFSVVKPPRDYSRCAACLNRWNECPAKFHSPDFTEMEKREEIDMILNALEASQHSREA